MKSDAIRVWLKKKKAWGSVQCESFAALGGLAGILVVFLTFWLAYAIIWFGWYGVSAVFELAFNKKPHLSHGLILLCSGIFIVLLFIQHFRTDPSHWGDYPRRDYVSSPALQMQAGAFGGLLFMLAYPGASANMVADILLVGPRLVTGTCQLAKKGLRMKKLDQDGCAALLSFLYSRINMVPYEDLKSANWEPWFDQLRSIDGVLFLEKGLVLSGELRSELNNLPAS
jgi:hypothetical protein